MGEQRKGRWKRGCRGNGHIHCMHQAPPNAKAGPDAERATFSFLFLFAGDQGLVLPWVIATLVLLMA